jgi:DHA1 family bicyclomycin/chloramphenicol resistance-like MFS transporter
LATILGTIDIGRGIIQGIFVNFKTAVLALMTALFFMAMAGTDMYISSLPAIAKEFCVTPDIANLTISAYNGSIAIFVLFAATLSDRFGRRAIMIFAPLAFALSAVIISVSSSIWMIIALRGVQAIGSALIIIVSREILKDIMDEREQLRANAIMLLGLVLSPALSPVIGAYLAEYFGWRSVFMFMGIIGLIFGLVVIKFLPETCKNKLESLPKASVFLSEYYEILKSRFFILMTLTFVSANGAFYAFIGISSYLYIDDFNISPILYSYVYTIMAAAYLIGNRYVLYLNAHSTPYNSILGIGINATLVGAIILMVCEAFSSNFEVLIIITIAAALMRVAGAMINPTSQILTLNHFKHTGGMALGLAMSMMFIVMSISISAVSLFHKNPILGIGIISIVFATIGALAFRELKKNFG